ncbi:MAG TPA: ABC transporter substrate-binding protein, partial [Spirochaetia bacterium]|nr:ABC transporter substrate-binding protein [Spirochaetia bacterium]
ILMRDQAKGATGFFMVEYYSEGQQFLNNWNTIGLSLPVVGTEGVDSTTQFFQTVGAQANGLVFATPFNRDSTEPVVVNFIKDFTAAYGYAPDMVGATTYDSFLVLKDAMTKGTSASQIRNGIADVTHFVGVTGTILKYNATGEVVKAVELQIVKDGLPHHYGTVDDPDVITP